MSDKLVQNVQLIRFMKEITFELQLSVNKIYLAHNNSQFVQKCVYIKLTKIIKIAALEPAAGGSQPTLR